MAAIRGVFLRRTSNLCLSSQVMLSTGLKLPSIKHVKPVIISTSSIHITARTFKDDKYAYHKKNIGNAVVLSKQIFSEVAVEKQGPSKESFEDAVKIFKERDIRMRGHIQFIETALKIMKKFGVEKDVAAYNDLMDVFPKGVFAARNPIQAIYGHYPEQNICAIRILQQMEDNGVMPNQSTKEIMISVFGRTGGAIKKYRRIMYWFPRFKNVNPFPLPKDLPIDLIEIAKLGLKRISEYEAEFNVVYLNKDERSELDCIDETVEFIATVQSSEQREMLHDYPRYRPVYVEGPFNLWLRDKKSNYFILRGHPLSVDDIQIEERVRNPYPIDVEPPRDAPPPSPSEGPLFAMCSTNSKDDAQQTMLRWVKDLQGDNPNLGKIPILFNIFKSSSPSESVALPAGNPELPDS